MRHTDDVQKPSYGAEFRQDALRYLESRRTSYRRAARELGVDVKTLRRWRRAGEDEIEAMKKRKKLRGSQAATATPTSAEPDVAQLMRDKRVLEKRLATLEMEHEILKKAAAFFAKGSK